MTLLELKGQEGHQRETFWILEASLAPQGDSKLKKCKYLQCVFLNGEYPIDWPVVPPPFILRNFHFMRKYGLRSQVGCKLGGVD